MTLLKKIIDGAKEKIDLLFLTRKVNCFVESESISTEEGISFYTKSIEKYIELKDIDKAFTQYEELKRKKDGWKI